MSFTITYADDTAVSLVTLGNANILIIGPNGFSQLATLSSTDATSDSPTIHATYTISAPAGGWPLTANGTYTSRLQSQQVSDSNGNFMTTQSLGTFTINVAHPAIDLGPSGSKGLKKTSAGQL